MPPSPSTPALPPAGQVDSFEDGVVLGWAAPADLGTRRLQVELIIDGEPVAATRADLLRGDVRNSGLGDGHYGFVLAIPQHYFDDLQHQALVRDAESGASIAGCPIEFCLPPAALSRQATSLAASPTVRGGVDECTQVGVSGWAAPLHDRNEAVVVECWIDGKLQSSERANLPRRDLLEADVGHGRHGFAFDWPETMYDGVEHEVVLRPLGSRQALSGSPLTVCLTPLARWNLSADDDARTRRAVAEAALDWCESAVDDAFDEAKHDTLLAMQPWLQAHAPARLGRRLQAQLDRLTRLRCVLTMDGLLSHQEIGVALRDTWAESQPVRLELVEGDEAVAGENLAASAAGAPRRAVFTLPEKLLDGQVHRFLLRVLPYGGLLGPWSFLLVAPNPTGDTPDWADDSVWSTTPAALAAQRRRKAQRPPPTAVQLARTAFDDARADFDALDAPGDEAVRTLIAAGCALGDELLQSGAWNDAAVQFRHLLTIDDEHLRAIGGLVHSLLAASDEAGAQQVLDDAMARLPDEGSLHSLADELHGRRRPHAVRTIAFYLPQFHPTAENNAWWGEGFTEWHNVGSGTPMFGGHQQPRRPTSLGYYDLRLPESVNAQFELARRYGIDGFCYYHYWFEGKRILSKPLDDLLAGRAGPFPFCICWANEDWTRSWDGMSGEVLMAQNHRPETDFAFIQDAAPLLRHPDYIRVDGKPMLLVYRADKLATPKETVAAWRQWCRDEGIGELHLCAVQSFGFHDPRPLGFDAAVEFPPHCPWDRYPEPGYLHRLENLTYTVSGFAGTVYDYQAFAKAAMSRPREPFTLHRTSMAAWDNTARRGKTAAVYHHFSIATFRNWMLANARRAATEQHDAVCFVNAWNEWAEGTVLEPDVHFGYEPLESARHAKRLAGFDPNGTYWRTGTPLWPEQRLAARERVLLVGHDAFPAGAQINLLNMARCLRRQLDMDVQIMLIEGGELLPEYERVAPTTVIGKTGDWRGPLQTQLWQLSSMGARKAICNTVATGDVIEVLKQHGFRIVGLLHEMPTVIETHGLQAQCWRFADKADAIVGASRIVADEYCHRYWPDLGKVLIAPQGIAFNPYVARSAAMRAEVRKELGLAPDCQLVIGCGYADTRKGIDLFVQMAGDVVRARPAGSVAFAWVGALEPAMAPYIHADARRLQLDGLLHITGRTKDPARYFIAADLFALTSREDPFPSVVMEAFDAGLPVLAFDGGGGYVDIVGDASGALLPYLDVGAMAQAAVAYLADDARRSAVGEHNHTRCRELFGYVPYMRKMLALLADVPAEQVAAGHLQRQPWFSDQPRPRITAIVPNYNYARYLELRLRTIAGQILPPDEIIVLDDASTDGSVALVQALAKELSIPLLLVTGERNTGNPFVQWAKGLERATGDLVWIAEADDYCEPTLLETLAREFIDDNVVMAWADSIMVDDVGRSQGAQYKDYYACSYGAKWRMHFRMPGSALIEDCLLIENVVPNASAVLFRRSAVRFDLQPIQAYRFSGDWWFWLSLARQGDVVYRADPLNYHRRHQHSVMGEVLRAGESLLPETMGFYQRVVAQYPDTVTARSARSVIKRLDQLYGMFPSLQAAAPGLREHPTFGPQWDALQSGLAGSVGATNQTTAVSTLIVLSEDVLGSTSDELLRLVRAARLCLLGPAKPIAAFLELHGLDEGDVQVLESEPYVTGQTQALRASLHERLVAIAKGAHHLISHGLLAHCAVAATIDRCDAKWTLVAGRDFDALLGQAMPASAVTLEELVAAVQRSDRAEFIGESVPHAFGRLVQAARRPVDRLRPLESHGAAKLIAGSASVRFFAIASDAEPDAWRRAARVLQAVSDPAADGAALRLLSWGDQLDVLRSALAGEPNVEVVEVYGPGSDAYNLGDVQITGEWTVGSRSISLTNIPLSLLDSEAGLAAIAARSPRVRSHTARSAQADSAPQSSRVTT